MRKVKLLVAQLCLTLSDPTDWSLPGSSGSSQHPYSPTWEHLSNETVVWYCFWAGSRGGLFRKEFKPEACFTFPVLSRHLQSQISPRVRFLTWKDLICCCSVAKWCLTLATLWTVAHQASLFSTISGSLLRFMSFESVMPSNHLILSHLQPFPASGSFPMSQLFTSKVLELHLQHQSFQWLFRVDFL